MGRAIIELLAYSILISRIYSQYSEALITETPNKHITIENNSHGKKTAPTFSVQFQHIWPPDGDLYLWSYGYSLTHLKVGSNGFFLSGLLVHSPTLLIIHFLCFLHLYISPILFIIFSCPHHHHNSQTINSKTRLLSSINTLFACYIDLMSFQLLLFLAIFSQGGILLQ